MQKYYFNCPFKHSQYTSKPLGDLIRWSLPTKRNVKSMKIFTHATKLTILILCHGSNIIVLGQSYFEL